MERQISFAWWQSRLHESRFFKCHLKHIKNLAKIANVMDSKETFIQHYNNKYHSPALPPIWVVVETMTFGTLSHWFENTKETAIKKAIMKAFNMPTIEIIESVFHALTPVRNVCAHHSRLWNRRFAISLPEIKRLRNSLVPRNAPDHQAYYLYNHLVVIETLMRAISLNSSWRKRLIDLLNTVEPNNHKAMGFPENWQNREPWNINNMENKNV